MSSGDTTPFGPAPVEPGVSARTANLAANAALQEALRPSREHIERIVRSLGATGDVPGLMDGVVTVPEVFCALTVPGFEFPRSDAPDSLHSRNRPPITRCGRARSAARRLTLTPASPSGPFLGSPESSR